MPGYGEKSNLLILVMAPLSPTQVPSLILRAFLMNQTLGLERWLSSEENTLFF